MHNEALFTCSSGPWGTQKRRVPSPDLSQNRTTLGEEKATLTEIHNIFHNDFLHVWGVRVQGRDWFSIGVLVCVCCCSLWPGDITLICPILVSQDASAWSQPIRSQKRKRSIDTSKRKKPSQASLRNRIEEEVWDLQETEGSDSGDEGSVRSDSQNRSEEQKGLSSGWLTVGFLSHSASVFGHVDPDPSPYGAHLLASVTQKGLKLLWRTGEWA